MENLNTEQHAGQQTAQQDTKQIIANPSDNFTSNADQLGSFYYVSHCIKAATSGLKQLSSDEWATRTEYGQDANPNFGLPGNKSNEYQNVMNNGGMIDQRFMDDYKQRSGFKSLPRAPEQNTTNQLPQQSKYGDGLTNHAGESMAAIVTDKNGNIVNIIRHTKGGKAESSVFPGDLVGRKVYLSCC